MPHKIEMANKGAIFLKVDMITITMVFEDSYLTSILTLVSPFHVPRLLF